MVKACFNNIIKFIACTLTVLTIFSAVTVNSYASGLRGAKEYIVGANSRFGISEVSSGFSGYACDFFEQFSKFSGSKYTYKKGTPRELFRMLAAGEIDIIPCVTESEMEAYGAEYFAGTNTSDDSRIKLTSFPIFTKFSAVYVYDNGPKRDTCFNDTEAIRKMKIGYLSDDEAEYFKDGKFVRSEIEEADFVSYSDIKEMESDFLSGEIDAVVKNCFDVFPDQTIVYSFGSEICYFAVRSNESQLLNKLNTCLEHLSVTYPNFFGDVYEKYVSFKGSQKYAYTDFERRYLESKSELVIAFNLETDIMHSYDATSNSVKGAAGDAFDRISEITGLKIKIIPCDTISECLKAVDDGKADVAFGDISSSGIVGHPDYLITSPITRSQVVIVGKEDTEIKEGTDLLYFCIGEDLQRYMELISESSGVKHLDSAAACLEQVRNSDSSVAFMGIYDFLYLKNHGYEDLSILKVCPVYHNDCFAVKEGKEALMGVVEKAISVVNGNSIALDAYSTVNTDTAAKDDKSYIVLLISTGLTALAVIVVGFMIITSVRSRRRAQVDIITSGRTREKFVSDSSRLMKKSSPERWALVVIDIDKFKYINDRLGYDEGNKMLSRVYRTMSDNMDGDEMCARISNDNFALMLHNAPDNDILNRLNNIFSEFERRNALYVKYPVVFSAGVCRLGQCEGKFGVVDTNIAIDRCIIAKKTVKALHGNSIAFYDGKIRDAVLREKDIENVMPQALENHEFMCYIQPKYGTKSRRIEGAEALIRWNSKDYGFVYPDQFIPVAEKNGFVVELDFFILEEVCKAMRRWLDDGITPVVISVNQSRMHLNNDDYIWRLREIVDKYEIPYEYLELELTESVFTEDTDRMLKIMRKLHDIGFKISIDDFGSGYSSLNMLKDIPADVVKIDREFFNGTVNSEKGRAVISTVVDLAKNLDMDVISEGVETLEQVEFLQEIDCHLVQGYYFAKPMPMADFEKLWQAEREEIQKENKNDIPDGEASEEADAAGKDQGELI